MSFGPLYERNQDATVYVGSLDERVTETLLWEMFTQAGSVVNVHMPKDRLTQTHQGYGFVEFSSEQDADYAIKAMNMIKLYNKPIKVNKACVHRKNLDVGANIFIGNLDNEVDEKLLYDTFSAFGLIVRAPKIMKDPETGCCKGYAFVNFLNFEASDAAIAAMHGQYLCNRSISVSYAFKQNSKTERHGSATERLLAAQNSLSFADHPNQLFADIGDMPASLMRPRSIFYRALPPPPPPPLECILLMPSSSNEFSFTSLEVQLIPPPPQASFVSVVSTEVVSSSFVSTSSMLSLPSTSSFVSLETSSITTSQIETVTPQLLTFVDPPSPLTLSLPSFEDFF